MENKAAAEDSRWSSNDNRNVMTHYSRLSSWRRSSVVVKSTRDLTGSWWFHSHRLLVFVLLVLVLPCLFETCFLLTSFLAIQDFRLSIITSLYYYCCCSCCSCCCRSSSHGRQQPGSERRLSRGSEGINTKDDSHGTAKKPQHDTSALLPLNGQRDPATPTPTHHTKPPKNQKSSTYPPF